MRTNHIVIATLSACLAAGTLLAQNNSRLVDSTTRALAEAQMAQARGEYQKAEAILNMALRSAKGSDRTRLLAAKGEKRQDPPAAQAAGKQDPVLRLIRIINEGTWRQDKVKIAMDELRSLDALAVPMLLKSLPELGPFGLRNALDLLRGVEDPRVRPALEALCEKPNDAVVHAITKELTSMRREVALPLAKRFANNGWPAAARIEALRVLARYDMAAAKGLAAMLTHDFSLHGDLLDLANDHEDELGPMIWRALSQANIHQSHRAAASGALMLRDKGLTEEAAMTTLEGMPTSYSQDFAARLAEQHADWVRVGLLAARTYRDPSRPLWKRSWFRNMEWWRRPTESIAMMLDYSQGELRSTDLKSPIIEIIRTGWELPEELQKAFAEAAPTIGWEWFARSLTPAGEARAIATWRDASPDERARLAYAVIELKLPWHELVLLQMESASGLESTLFEDALARTWHGMSTDQSKRLANLIASWQEQWPAEEQPRWKSNAASRGTSNQPSWVRSLTNGYSKNSGIPSDVLLPLIRDDYGPALSVMSMMEPQRALQLAMKWPLEKVRVHREILAYVLTRNGDARHIDLALAVSRENVRDKKKVRDLSRYLVEHGRGDLRVIALARRPGMANKDLISAALRAADGAHISDRSELIDLLPVLEGQTAYAVLRSLDPQWQPSHAKTVMKLLDAVLASASSKAERQKAAQLDRALPEKLAEHALRLASRLEAKGVVDRAKAVLATKDAVPRLQREAAHVLLQQDATDRVADLAKLLQHSDTAVVEVALVQPELAADAGLRKLALTACLEHGEKLSDIDGLLDNLEQVDRIALAKAVVSNPRFPSVSRGASLTALRVLGDQKDPSLVAAIAKGNSHGDSVVREMVAMQLGRTFAKEAVPFLIDMLRDDSSQVRGAAESNLEQISNYLEAREKWQGRIK